MTHDHNASVGIIGQATNSREGICQFESRNPRPVTGKDDGSAHVEFSIRFHILPVFQTRDLDFISST
jgi:hypothetical protein